MSRRPAFWIAYAALAAAALGVAWRLFPLAIPLVNLDITLSRAAAIAQGRGRSRRRTKLAPDGVAERRPRFAHDSATQNYVELEGGGKAAFAALVKGDRLRAVLVGGADLQARRGERGRRSGSGPTARRTDSCAGCPKRTCATRRRRRSTRPRRARSAEERATADWKFDLAPYALLEQSQQTRPAGRVDHTFVYERARAARRRADPAAAHRRRRRAGRDRALCPRSRVVRAPVSRAAQRERHDRRNRRRRRRVCSTASAAASSACCGSRASTGSSCVRRSAPASSSAGLMALVTLSAVTRRMVRLRHRAVGDDVLAAAGRRGGRRRARRRARVRARVHGRGEPDPPRVPHAAATVAGLVARRRRDARGAGSHDRRLPVRPGRARAGRRVLLRDEPMARLVAALRGADRSQHPVVRGAGADADRACRCRPGSWRSACFAPCRSRSVR